MGIICVCVVNYCVWDELTYFGFHVSVDIMHVCIYRWFTQWNSAGDKHLVFIGTHTCSYVCGVHVRYSRVCICM